MSTPAFRIFACASAYALAVVLGQATRVEGTLPLFWPAAGIAFAWLALAWRSRARPLDAAALFAVSLGCNLAAGDPAAMAVGFGVASTVHVVVACAIFARLRPEGFRLAEVRDLLALTAGALAGGVAGALTGPVAARLAGMPGWPIAFEVMVLHYAASALVVTAVLLRLTGLAREDVSGWRVVEFAVAVCASLGVVFTVFGLTTGLPIGFLVLPAAIAVALRYATTPVAVHGLIASVLVIALTLAGHGPFAEQSPVGQVVQVQALLGVMAFLTLALALHRDERRRLRRHLDGVTRRVERITANAPVVLFQLRVAADGAPRLTFVSDGDDAGREAVSALLDAERPPTDAGAPWAWRGPVAVTGGAQRWLYVTARGEALKDGAVLWDGLVIDETEQRRSEAAAAESRELVDGLADNFDGMFFAKDVDGRYLFLNTTYERLFDIDRADIAGERDEAIHAPDVAARLRESDRVVLESGQPVTFAEDIPVAGELRHYITRKFPLRDADGTITGVAGLAVDNTDRHRLEATMREVEERFETAFERAPIGMIIVAPDGRYERVNEAYCAMTGYAAAELVQMWSYQIVHPDDIESMAEHTARLARGETVTVEHRIRHAEGRDVWVQAKVAVIFDDAGEPLHVLVQSQDITERRAAAEAMERAHAEALEASRLKSEFVANMSHELRTPLNGVIGMTAALLHTELDDQQRQYAANARKAGEALLGLISDILDFSKIEAGRLELDEVDFDVRAVVSDAVAIVAESASEKGLELTSEVAAGVPALVRGDDQRMRQVVLNLLSNAVKFTADGAIAVRVEAGERLRIAVADTGIGISPERQERLWDAFTQEDASTTRRFGGTGLGLTISRQLVEAMGGTIAIDSAPGAGSTFTIDLPLVAASGEPAPAAAAEEPSRFTTAGPLVLVAEDNEVNQMVAEAFLEHHGFRVDIAPDGRRAVEMSAATRYAAIFMDCQMPEMDGYEATAAIRAREAGTGERLLIVAMTANALAGDRERCTAAGMDDYVAKPLVEDELVRVLDGIRAAAG